MPGAVDTLWREAGSLGAHWKDGAFDGPFAWQRMREAYRTAAVARPDEFHQAHLRFAGRPVRLDVVGSELFTHVLKPFAHLVDEGGSQPDLVIELWDDRLVGALPAPEREGGQVAWREATLRSADDRFIAQRLPHTLSCLDREARHLVAGIAWTDRIFIYERSKPFARLLLNWYNDHGIQVIHTGLVARNGIGALIAGPSGSGKSTSTLACALGGLDFLGEDYVGLESREDGTFVGHSLYNSVFLNSGHLARFDALAGHAIHGQPPQEAKSVVLLSQVAPGCLARSAALRAIVFPQVGESRPAQLGRMAKPAALLALAPSSLLQIPNRHLGVPGFSRLAQIVERLPCHRMTVGSDLASIPRCIDDLLQQVGGCAP